MKKKMGNLLEAKKNAVLFCCISCWSLAVGQSEYGTPSIHYRLNSDETSAIHVSLNQYSENTDMKLRNCATSKHLPFLGTTFGASFSALKKSLALRSIKYCDTDAIGYVFEGTIMGVKNATLHVLYDSNGLFKAVVNKTCYSRTEVNEVINAIKAYIHKGYNNLEGYGDELYKSEHGAITREESWCVYSADGSDYVGYINLRRPAEEEDDYLEKFYVEVKFIDMANYSSHLGLRFDKCYDISNFVKPTYSSGVLRLYRDQFILSLYDQRGLHHTMFLNGSEEEALMKVCRGELSEYGGRRVFDHFFKLVNNDFAACSYPYLYRPNCMREAYLKYQNELRQAEIDKKNKEDAYRKAIEAENAYYQYVLDIWSSATSGSNNRKRSAPKKENFTTHGLKFDSEAEMESYKNAMGWK